MSAARGDCVATKRVGDVWHSKTVPCGKPAKEEHDGRWLCGLHAGVEKRKEQTRLTRQIEDDRQSAAAARRARVGERLGIEVDYHPWLGCARVDLESLEALADRLEGL